MIGLKINMFHLKRSHLSSLFTGIDQCKVSFLLIVHKDSCYLLKDTNFF